MSILHFKLAPLSLGVWAAFCSQGLLPSAQDREGGTSSLAESRSPFASCHSKSENCSHLSVNSTQQRCSDGKYCTQDKPQSGLRPCPGVLTSQLWVAGFCPTSPSCALPHVRVRAPWRWRHAVAAAPPSPRTVLLPSSRLRAPSPAGHPRRARRARVPYGRFMLQLNLNLFYSDMYKMQPIAEPAEQERSPETPFPSEVITTISQVAV